MAISHDPRVATVEEDAYGRLSYNVEYYSDDRLWHLNRIDQRSSVPANPTKAYGWTSTGSNVDVYVIDSGILASHSEFANGNVDVTEAADFALDGYSPTNPCGGMNRYGAGHGTAVASLIAGRTRGVARGATLIPIKVLKGVPNPPAGSSEIILMGSETIQAIDHVRQRIAVRGRKAIVNMSFYFELVGTSNGDTSDPSCPDQPNNNCVPAFEHAVKNLLNADVVVVASANNQGRDRCATQTPARMGYYGVHHREAMANPYITPEQLATFTYAVTVGGINIQDQRHTCATCNQLRDPASNFGDCVDIYAPARLISGAHIASNTAYRDEQTWVDARNLEQGQNVNTVENVTTGTSWSAAIASGVAARLRQTFPNASAREIWNYMESTATAAAPNFDNDNIAHNDRILWISVYE